MYFGAVYFGEYYPVDELTATSALSVLAFTGPALHVAAQGSPYINGYPFVGSIGARLANPATLPTGNPSGSQCLAQSPDEAFLAISHATTPFLSVYAWDGAAYGSKVANPAALPGASSAANGVAWSPDGRYVAVCIDASPYIEVYAWSPSSGFGSKISNPASLPGAACVAAAWSPDGAYLAVVHGSSPYVEVYAWSAGFGAKVSAPSTTPTGAAKGLAWSPDSRWLAVAHTTSPYVTAYEWSAGFGEKLTDPGTAVAGNGLSVAFNRAGTLLAVGHSTSPFLTVYKWGGGFGDKHSDPSTLPTSAANSVAFSPDGQYLAVATDTAPHVRAWAIGPRSGFGSVLPDPATTPAAAGKGVLFSTAGVALESTLDNRYRLSNLTWEVAAQFAREAYYQEVMEDTPASYWRLAETSGTTAKDVKRAVAGTYNGGYTLAQAPILESDEGYSVALNGSTGYVDCNDNYDYAGTASFTVEALVKLDTIAGVQGIVAKLGSTGGTQGWYLASSSGTIASQRYRNGTAGLMATGPTNIAAGALAHVAVVYDGSTLTVYVNGVAGTAIADTASIVNDTGDLVIGNGGAVGVGFLDGNVQDVAIYSSALSAARILAHAQAAAAFGTDLRSYIEGPISVARGLAPDGRPQVGHVTIELTNADGTFTNDNSSSALYGLLQPLVPIRMRATDPTTNAVIAVWRGQIMRYTQRYPRTGELPFCTIDCEGRLGHLQRVRPTTYSAFASAPDIDGAISTLATGSGLRTADLDLEDDLTVANRFAPSYEEDTLSQMALAQEGSCSLVPNLFEGKDGRIKYRSTTTLGSSAGAVQRLGDYSVIKPVALDYDARHDDRVAEVETTNKNTIGLLEGGRVVYAHPLNATSSSSTEIPAGGSIVIEAPYGEFQSGTAALVLPIRGVVTVITPVASVDYFGNENATGGGANRTASLSLTFEDGGTGFRAVFTNTHATNTCYLTMFQVRADQAHLELGGTYRLRDPLFRAFSLTPKATVDLTHWPLGGGTVGAQVLLSRRYAIPRLTAEFDWDSNAIQTAMLLAELCELYEVEDRFGLWASQVRDVWRMESITHTFYPRGNGQGQINRSVVTLRPSYAHLNPASAVTDTFEKAARSGTLGDTDVQWSTDTSWTTYAIGAGLTWSIASSAAAPDSATEGWATLTSANYVSGRPGKDQIAKVLLTGLLDAGSTWIAGLVYRGVAATKNHWRVQIDRANLQVQLIYRDGGGDGTDHTAATATWTLEDEAELRVIVQGTRHRIYLNGAATPVIDVVEDRSLLTGPEAGIYAINGASVRFKRFMAAGSN